MAVSRAHKNNTRLMSAERLVHANATIVARYDGVKTVELVDLRCELRKVGAEFRVAKNRVVKKAIELDCPDAQGLKDQLKGPIGLIYLKGDVAAGSKILVDFAKKADKFQLQGGILDGNVVSLDDIKAISSLPSKEELLAKIVGSLVSPHRGLLQVVNGVGTKLVRAIAAIRDTKSS